MYMYAVPYIYQGNISTFELLHNISLLFGVVNVSTRTKEETAYLTVAFVGNNHGSWVDIVATLILNTIATAKLQYLNFSHQNTIQMFETETNMVYLLWFRIYCHNCSDNFHIDAQVKTYLPDTGYYEISMVEWVGRVALSDSKPHHCVSTQGVVSGGTLSSAGEDQLHHFSSIVFFLCDTELIWTIWPHNWVCHCCLPFGLLPQQTPQNHWKMSSKKYKTHLPRKLKQQKCCVGNIDLSPLSRHSPRWN